MIPGSSFFGWQSGANRDAAEESIRTGEPVKLGFLEKLYGGKTEDAQNIVNREQQKALNNKYALQIAQNGLTGADWGETEQQLLGKIATRSQERADGQSRKAKSERLEQRGYEASRSDTRFGQEMAANRQQNEANLQFQAQENAANRQDANARFAFQHKLEGDRNAHQASESALDRSLTRDMTNSSNDLAMQMKFMESDLADKRMDYDRETRRMDKRDRMIAQLMNGLGQLGGAFAA